MSSYEHTALLRELAEEALKTGTVIATAESCTGGGISWTITGMPGSSGWFDRGFVTYTAKSKSELLGVNSETISKYGVVSEEVAREMAAGALRHSDANLSVSVTGIAGPGGAEPGKPVGTVCIGFSELHGGEFVTASYTGHFPGGREEVREGVIQAALSGLLMRIKSRS